ncbi:Isopentenyl-diphosphate Delta-isomerase [Corynebacterium ciconiae DSM 44920]|uniref:isopentenyl-diphosphate Delta-isomerase n=1 Tax=Corynebacterium ciconiae TaxID=227319 RepID=UPI000475F5DA|nr:isopentenyl-diphosphate Delta-isomerase [Corynebacterium ciconiae]WKD60652.1 Isopentenyl-diphosphate Delta-isomerase [Corynebacterium ciconiae DSM 44920]
MNACERVVVLDSNNQPIGTAVKSEVHTTDTPYHLAFSCYVLSDKGDVLLTRRALSKATWPGVWTNSFCGHPGPGEEIPAAIRRRAQQELGLEGLYGIEEVLPTYSYRAVDSSGIVEHEFCPVYIARIDATSTPQPATTEVDSFGWATPAELAAAVDATGFAFSPWMVDQLRHRRLREALGCLR